jgi:hypothetical protein
MNHETLRLLSLAYTRPFPDRVSVLSRLDPCHSPLQSNREIFVFRSSYVDSNVMGY